jgi:hypothetical protein
MPDFWITKNYAVPLLLLMHNALCIIRLTPVRAFREIRSRAIRVIGEIREIE